MSKPELFTPCPGLAAHLVRRIGPYWVSEFTTRPKSPDLLLQRTVIRSKSNS